MSLYTSLHTGREKRCAVFQTCFVIVKHLIVEKQDTSQSVQRIEKNMIRVQYFVQGIMQSPNIFRAKESVVI